MSDIGYFSMYARFETESKEDAAASRRVEVRYVLKTE